MKLSVAICFFVLLLSEGYLSAQKHFSDAMTFDSAALGIGNSALNKNSKKSDFDLSVDMGYMYLGFYGSNQYMHFNPSYKYKVNPKLEVVIGSKFTLSRLTGLNNELYNSGSVTKPLARPSVLLFGEGTYSLSKKLTITGSVFKSITNNERYSPFMNDLDIEGITLDLNYKIHKNISFGAQFRYLNIDGYYNPYSPYGYPYHYFYR